VFLQLGIQFVFDLVTIMFFLNRGLEFDKIQKEKLDWGYYATEVAKAVISVQYTLWTFEVSIAVLPVYKNFQ